MATFCLEFGKSSSTLGKPTLVLNRTNPEIDEFEILDRFRNNGLEDPANYLHALL
jgi:hypothetical protein